MVRFHPYVIWAASSRQETYVPSFIKIPQFLFNLLLARIQGRTYEETVARNSTRRHPYHFDTHNSISISNRFR